MDILYKKEHTSCRNHLRSDKAIIDVVKIDESESCSLAVNHNQIICIVEGSVRYCFEKIQKMDAIRGQLLFCPAGTQYTYEGVTKAMIVVFNLTKSLALCNQFALEKLYAPQLLQRKLEPHAMPILYRNRIGLLEANTQIWNYLTGVICCVADGIRCKYWCELKTEELLFLLRGYYTKQALHDFFHIILSEDTTFSEYVRANWLEMLSVQKLAESMHLSRKQFTTRFLRIFGETPLRWMAEKRAEKAYNELTTTKKTIRDISLICGFGTDTELTRFCKKEFGLTPTELRKPTEKRKKVKSSQKNEKNS